LLAEDALFVSNYAATGNGGNICLQDMASAVVKDCNISHGWAMYGGGGVFLQGSASALIQDSVLVNNSVRAMDNSTFVVEKSKLLNGTPDISYSGHGFEAYDNTSAVVRDTLVANIVSMEGASGGAFYASETARLVLEDVLVRDNRAFYGAGLFARGNAQVSILGDTLFKGNKASSGNDLYIGPRVNLTIPPESSIVSKCVLGEDCLHNGRDG